MKAVYGFLSTALAVMAVWAAPAPAEEGVEYPAEISYQATGKSVVFSHKAHVEDFGLACDECHTAIFKPKTGSAKEEGDFTMNSLYAGKYCGVCHDGDRAFASDDFTQCERCHSGNPPKLGKGKLTGPKAPISLGSGDNVAVFKHAAHASVACIDCHAALFPMKADKTVTSMDEINQKKSCGTCHNGQKAFDASECGKCHPKM